MRKDLVRFLREISDPLIWIGLAMLFICSVVAYFTDAIVVKYIMDNVLPVPLAMAIVGLACELLRIKLDDNSNAKSEELL